MMGLLFNWIVLSIAGTTVLAPKFDALLSISPGSSTDKVREVFGKPDKSRDLKKFDGVTETGYLWEYLEGKGQGVRLSITVDPSQKKVVGWSWAVLDNEVEQDLKVVLTRFPSAKWKADMPKWANPHQEPLDCYYNDRALGVTIEFGLVKKQVKSISRWDPVRGLASDKEDKPPRYCIDSFCSDARLSEDVYTDPMHPVCELPK
jgi:hypothetical protein